ncbi:MAG TPA: DNA-directed RNA polymerase subunit L [Candidatus Nanoarchaeia archaeon]|nr:DNA-directed RNA polymerase subunit L [Candidatus Nanoarchaeia archaeon]
MEINVLEHTKQRLQFELKGEGHTFCNVLRKELWLGKAPEIAGYAIEHSLVSQPVFAVESDKQNPVALLTSAVERLQKKTAELQEKFKKL